MLHRAWGARQGPSGGGHRIQRGEEEDTVSVGGGHVFQEKEQHV